MSLRINMGNLKICICPSFAHIFSRYITKYLPMKWRHYFPSSKLGQLMSRFVSRECYLLHVLFSIVFILTQR